MEKEKTVGSRTSWPSPNVPERHGTSTRTTKNKTLPRQSTSLQSDSSVDKASGDDSLSKSNSSQSIAAMKTSSSVGDFQTREVTKSLPTPVREEEDLEFSEVNERSSSALMRSRTLPSEVTLCHEPQHQQQSTELSNATAKGFDSRSQKLPQQNENVDPLNTANASAKHRKERFVKNFPDIAVSEDLLQYYYCAYSRDILFPGFMYVTQGWICFHSKIMSKKNIRIPVHSIVDITKERTAKLIPNAIGIATQKDRHVFASLVSRDRTYSLLMSIWKQKRKQEDEDSLNGSSQNGERNDGIDDCSDSIEDSIHSGSDDSQYFENRTTSGARSEVTSIRRDGSPDVITRRHRTNNSPETVSSHDVTTSNGRKPESSAMNRIQDKHPWRLRFSGQIPSFSSTTIILFLTTILIVFLILSAGMLAVRVVQLQAQMEANLVSSSISNLNDLLTDYDLNDQTSEDIYHLKHDQHLSNIQRLHTLLEIHLRLLEKVNQSLKSLRHSTPKSCSGLSTDEYVSDTSTP